MKIITLDFESLWDDEYTLKKLSTSEYIRDPRFEALGCSIKFEPTAPARWWNRDELPQLFKSIDWTNTGALAHHGQFDFLILSHHYGVHPKFCFDTLSCARLLLGNHLSVGLDALAKHYGLAAKTVPYQLFKGKRWHELSPEVQKQLADGCNHDVELTWQLFQILGKDMPPEEFEVIDIVIKMFTQPALRADVELLATIWEDEENKKAARLAALNVDVSELQSAEKFAALLRAEGIEPAMKQGRTSTKTGKSKLNYAFAKTDPQMVELLEHPNERIRTLCEARLGEKSTILQTRAETLGFMAQGRSGHTDGTLPVYIRYAGAGTLRPTGGDSTNFLNLKRRSPIRRALCAPEGYLLAPVDASQIEFRVCLYLAGQQDQLDILRKGGDPYIDVASEFYGEQIYKAGKADPRREEMEAKRGAGKQAKLMCIYGAAGKQFQTTARNGLYGPPINMTLEDAERFVSITRNMLPAVCAPNTGYWAQAGRMLARLGGGPEIEWGPLLVKDHRIYLPNGCPVIYDSLEYFVPPPEDAENYREFERRGFWRLRTRQGWKTMWGSKLVQNVCEAVARVIVSQAAIRISRQGYRILNWPYDELLCLIPRDSHEDRHVQVLLDEMRRPPDWLPGIPLDAEVTVGERYSK